MIKQMAERRRRGVCGSIQLSGDQMYAALQGRQV